MMRKGFFLLAVLVAAGAAEASAQEVTARIAGLEGNAEYMAVSYTHLTLPTIA